MFMEPCPDKDMRQSLHPLAMTFDKKCFRFANNGAFSDIPVPFSKMQCQEGRFITDKIFPFQNS